ncbi:MAG TPA: sialidase family protein [Pyrinomonadaceae bacterium]|jgi:hypothetical protein
MTRILIWSCLISLAFVTGCARFSADASRSTFKPLQISAAEVDAAEPVTASAPDGGVYVAWVNHNENNQADVMLARFDNTGVAIGSPVRVNQQAGVATAWRGDPPSVAVTDRAVYVLWTARVESQGKKGTDLYLSVSHDHGQTFASTVKVNDDTVPGAHGMHSLAVPHDGRIYAAWLDERNIESPKPSPHAGGHHMESNRELFVAYSIDGGKTFSANQKVASDACPCCKTALAVAPDGTVYASWRQVLPGNFRHIAVASSTNGAASFSAPVIVSDDKWMLQGCPVSGPSLSVAANGDLKVLWYAAGEGAAPGLYYAESHDKGRTFAPRTQMAEETVKGTPALVAGQNRTIAIWQGVGAQPETRMRELGGAGSIASVAANGELPSAAFGKDKLFVAYIAKAGEKRSIWLTKF